MQFFQISSWGITACGMVSVSTVIFHLTNSMSEAIKLRESSPIKIPTLCKGFHTSTYPNQRRLKIHLVFKVFKGYSILHRFIFFETYHFLSALHQSSLSWCGWGKGCGNCSRSPVMFWTGFWS